MTPPRNAKIDTIALRASIFALAIALGVALAVISVTNSVTHTDVAITVDEGTALETVTTNATSPETERMSDSTKTPTPRPTTTASPTVISATAEPTGPIAETAIPPPIHTPTVAPELVSTPTAAPEMVTSPPSIPVAPKDTTESPALINRLVIPNIGVDAPVEVQSLYPDGAMQSPTAPDVVAWYDFSSRPVDSGNAVFAGHLDYAGYGPAVFWRLDELRPGDVIEVYYGDGTIVRYSVTSIQAFAATDDATGIVASRDRPTITLITCDGAFDNDDRAYDERLVVSGDRID